MSPTKEDYQIAWSRRCSREDARLFISAIENGAAEAHSYASGRWQHGNFATAQGWMRRQNISNDIKNFIFERNITIQSRDYKGHFLLGDERCNNFDLIMFEDDVGAIIYRASLYKAVPRRIPINTFLANQGRTRQRGIFPRWLLKKMSALRKDLLPAELRVLYFIRYWYADDDPSGAKIGNIEVIVMDEDCKNVLWTVCDLREYAGRAAMSEEFRDAEQDLPMAFRTPDTDEGEDDLPINRRDDLDLN